MFQKYIFEIVCVFFMRQLTKYLESFEYELFKQDLENRIRDIIPGTAFDEAGVKFMNTILEGVEFIITNAEVTGIIEAIKNKDLSLALSLIKDSLKRYMGF